MSQHPGAGEARRTIRELEDRIREREALLQRMVVRGTPTQAAEDELRRLYAALQEMKGTPPVQPDGRALHRGLLNRSPRRLREFK